MNPLTINVMMPSYINMTVKLNSCKLNSNMLKWVVVLLIYIHLDTFATSLFLFGKIIYNIECTILTISKGTVKWHQVNSHSCKTITFTHFWSSSSQQNVCHTFYMTLDYISDTAIIFLFSISISDVYSSL